MRLASFRSYSGSHWFAMLKQVVALWLEIFSSIVHLFKNNKQNKTTLSFVLIVTYVHTYISDEYFILFVTRSLLIPSAEFTITYIVLYISSNLVLRIGCVARFSFLMAVRTCPTLWPDFKQWMYSFLFFFYNKRWLKRSKVSSLL